MARGKRGGYRAPARPAPVSGMGANSARTDGRVPTPPVTGLPYGENKAVAEQQAAAPLSPQGGAAGAGAGPAPRPAGGPPRFGDQGVFGPTGRPAEPLTAGIDWGAGPGAPPPASSDDLYMAARALYAVSPTPELERLIARISRA